MGENIFKYVNGRFVMTEGYGSVKKLKEMDPAMFSDKDKEKLRAKAPAAAPKPDAEKLAGGTQGGDEATTGDTQTSPSAGSPDANTQAGSAKPADANTQASSVKPADPNAQAGSAKPADANAQTAGGNTPIKPGSPEEQKLVQAAQSELSPAVVNPVTQAIKNLVANNEVTNSEGEDILDAMFRNAPALEKKAEEEGPAAAVNAAADGTLPDGGDDEEESSLDPKSALGMAFAGGVEDPAALNQLLTAVKQWSSSNSLTVNEKGLGDLSSMAGDEETLGDKTGMTAESRYFYPRQGKKFIRHPVLLPYMGYRR